MSALRRTLPGLAACAAVSAVLIGQGVDTYAADAYPSRPVRVIVPFAAGGTLDLSARITGQQLSEQLGRPFVIDNRPGATGIIGYGIVARAAPDGYTLTMIDTGFSIVPSVRKSLPYDVIRDFTPITQVIGVPRAMVVHPGVKSASLKEFVALARANPGKLNYGSGGAGGINHLSCILFNRAANVDIAHIPFKGAGEATAAVIAGQVNMVIAAAPAVVPHVQAGRLRALAVTTHAGKRFAALPDVPSMEDAGVSGMTLITWFGMAGPAGMPAAIVDRLHAEVAKALTAPVVRERFQGSELVGSSPQEFAAVVRSDVKLWAELVKSAGVTPE
jgi:tripartite-type tricarboxylate transporter receptor subunit TctC